LQKPIKATNRLLTVLFTSEVLMPVKALPPVLHSSSSLPVVSRGLKPIDLSAHPKGSAI
jgi:hypothetical protein